MDPAVAAFTDTYLPTVNGVTYTVSCWRDRWHDRGGRMDVVYPDSDEYAPEDGEHPVGSLPFPFYDGFRVAAPSLPGDLDGVDLVHAHTPFSLGLAGLRLARRRDVPFVASYHTPTSEYAEYIAPRGLFDGAIERVISWYERVFFGRADLVVVPTEPVRNHLVGTVGVSTDVRVLSNGVDTERFTPASSAAVERFRERHDLPDGPLVGYTGRHGYEKRLPDLIEAAEGIDDVTVVFGGDGPERDRLRRRARAADVDVRLLGFLDREELSTFYTALDAFAFPSPVETQGLVALEANACGTPVVGVDAGALSHTIDDGETGYHYPPGDLVTFRDRIERALAERERLRETCLARRDRIGVAETVEKLGALYRTL
ncbi:glycosyl transferase family 1 [Halobacteriales archaeon SW_7_68_16]|nr:MAG: glycosyl transferase family 1 [Halobacteriales archaeon SW_7_68_16]